MSPIVEFEGKTVEQALKEASKKLNIPEGKLKHDVISHGSSGIFGLVGTKNARIRVNVPETEKQRKKNPSEKPKHAKEETVKALVAEAFGREEPQEEPNKEPQKEPQEKVQEEAPQEVAPEVVEIGKTALQTLVDHITSDTVIQNRSNGERIFYHITGGNTAILIGKRGQTLEALQYLVEKIVNKQGGKRIRVEIDVEGYLENKRQKLETLALKLSEKVKQTKKPATVGQLNAYDRRIVHLALKTDNAVRTHSIGEGYYRKLKIFPKQRNRKTKNK